MKLSQVGTILASSLVAVLGQFALAQEFNPGLLWQTGNAPGNPTDCEAPDGCNCWYVDADAPDGGIGSTQEPFNSFERVVGYISNGGSYQTGLIRGGDYLYVRGTFKASEHTNETNNQNIYFGRGVQGGTASQPTVVKTWPGSPRAVFDGEYSMTDIIAVKQSGGIRIQDIEVKQCKSRGINIYELNTFVEVVNCEIHHTTGDGILGTGGGINFYMANAAAHDFTMRNCLVYANKQNQVGGDNNVGGISILSEGGAGDGSIIKIYDNIVYDEKHAIRHKHSGNITMDAHHNLIYDCLSGFYLRAYHKNLVHHNIIINSTGFICEAEGAQGDFYADIYNNTLVGGGNIVNTGRGTDTYKRTVNLFDNIYHSPSTENVITLGRWTTSVFDMAGWSSSKNMYTHANASTFLWKQNVSMNFAEAMSYLGDQGSVTADPGFVSLATRDFRLTAGSQARGLGNNGNDIGALPYGSTYVLDLNRKTVVEGPSAIAILAPPARIRQNSKISTMRVYSVSGRFIGSVRNTRPTGIYFGALNSSASRLGQKRLALR